MKVRLQLCAEDDEDISYTFRHSCVELLRRMMQRHGNHSHMDQYARLVEQRIFQKKGGKHDPYVTHIRMIATNLYNNAPFLVNRFTPSKVVQLDTSVLILGTEKEAWQKSYVAQKKKEAAMLDTSDPLQADEGGEALIKCSRCKSSNVSWEQKQTRGADESMTVFFECKNCFKRWKMS